MQVINKALRRRVLTKIGSVSLLGFAGLAAIGGHTPVLAQVGRKKSSVACVSWGPNRLDIFGVGTDNQMYHKAWNGTCWLPSQREWEPLGGSFRSSPAAVSGERNRLNLIALGTDNQMYHKAWNGHSWLPSQNGWEPLAIGMPSRVEKPMLVSRLEPALIAHRLASLPRCAAITLPAAKRCDWRASARAMNWYESPWKP
ncbi:hypothetical protein AWB67_07514 [Caballeronia terrestris]|uniref:PLL-like beta propeller domain-containing protein n=1 Tax=Caballeronia terrestris TaxID=1226301 RepID=A0A158L4W8_9BURK|nr:hypothetical protein AWB67_07514 [Caballeronia terrestris]